MQVKVTHSSKTQVVAMVVAGQDELQAIKDVVLSQFQGRVKVAGFRSGKTPANILEKNVDANVLQTEFLEQAIEQLYTQAIKAQNLRPVDRPNVSITKFVPFSTLEFTATTSVLGDVKLADYKKIKKTKPVVKLTDKDVAEVISSLQNQLADKKDVDRVAKDGDVVYIDFAGKDAKGMAVKGAAGKDYPLTIGSKAFIPGFEQNVVGMKAGDEKSFSLTFPKDYSVKALGAKKVTFTVSVTKVQAVELPEVDEAFAAKAGPFKTVAELKEDIKKQVGIERQKEADRAYENDLITEISNKSTVDIPEVLITDQMDRMEQEERQNLTYRGQTWQEHLLEEGTTEEKHRSEKRPQATERIKASLVMAEIAEAEGLEVTPAELDARINVLKQQYQDPQMQAELAKPEARREIVGRIMTEKTLTSLVSYATK